MPGLGTTYVNPQKVMQSWSVNDGLELYNVPLWADGFFDGNAAGHVVARP